MLVLKRLLLLIVVTSTCARLAQSQDDSGSTIETASAETARTEISPKRILGVLPNYRTTPTFQEYKPLVPRQKFKLATEDSFDRGTFILGALFAGQGDVTKSTPSFGQGPSGDARYFAASYADFVIGNYMTEAIYPTILHEDPRYFRRDAGGVWPRLGSAVGQIFRTRSATSQQSRVAKSQLTD
jgi:hypothetical protein